MDTSVTAYMRAISLKDWVNCYDWNEITKGRIGFRTPTKGECFKRLEWHCKMGSVDFYRKVEAGYRKHAFIFGQIGKMRSLGLLLNETQTQRSIAWTYID